MLLFLSPVLLFQIALVLSFFFCFFLLQQRPFFSISRFLCLLLLFESEHTVLERVCVCVFNTNTTHAHTGSLWENKLKKNERTVRITLPLCIAGIKCVATRNFLFFSFVLFLFLLNDSFVIQRERKG